jgi:hypothetical protein
MPENPRPDDRSFLGGGSRPNDRLQNDPGSPRVGPTTPKHRARVLRASVDRTEARRRNTKAKLPGRLKGR